MARDKPPYRADHVGRISKQLCVLLGVQGPALTAVIADTAVIAMARTAAIQALI
jgi:hypothetical protein